MHPGLVKHFLLPAWQYRNRQNSLRSLEHLEKTQWLSGSELLDLQWQRLGNVLTHAYDHVPYYREMMQAIGADPHAIVRDRSLEKLPLLERSTISRQLERFRATNLPADRFLPNGTGGSTGEPLRFYDDREHVGWSDAAVWRSHRWFGVDVGDPCAYLWGANFDVAKFTGFYGRLKSRLLNLLMLPAWELDEPMSDRFWSELVRFRPKLIVGYTGAMHNWARLLGNTRDRIPGLSAIVVSAEMLYDDSRRLIEDCFKVPVYNRYGGRDLRFVAQQCSYRNGLHINSENCLVEIVKDGRQVPPGEIGEVVLTRLDNFAMPFIRYRTGDLAVMAGSTCACGRSLPRLERIEGRVQDSIVTTDGRIISGPFFAHMMKDCPDVREFQVHQLSMDRLSIMVVLHRQADFASRPRIERLTRQYMGDRMQINFEVRESIPLTPSGKRRVIVSHLRANAQPSFESGVLAAAESRS